MYGMLYWRRGKAATPWPLAANAMRLLYTLINWHVYWFPRTCEVTPSTAVQSPKSPPVFRSGSCGFQLSREFQIFFDTRISVFLSFRLSWMYHVYNKKKVQKKRIKGFARFVVSWRSVFSCRVISHSKHAYNNSSTIALVRTWYDTSMSYNMTPVHSALCRALAVLSRLSSSIRGVETRKNAHGHTMCDIEWHSLNCPSFGKPAVLFMKIATDPTFGSCALVGPSYFGWL